MNRPLPISILATILFLEAFYELILFPVSSSNPALQSMMEQLPYSIDLLTRFGFFKGIYALLGAIGLWRGIKQVRYILWFVTPLFPIASFFITGGISLAPFSIVMTLIYIHYLRLPAIIDFFAHQKVQKSHIDILVGEEKVVNSAKVPTSGLGVLQKVSLFFGGYLLLNAVTTLSMLSSPINWTELGIVLFEFLLAALATASALRFGKVDGWRFVIRKQFYVVGALGLMYSFVLYSVLDTPQADALNEMMNGVLSSVYVIQNALYSLFIVAVGWGIAQKIEETTSS
jgi:hypothetical protein